MRNAKDTFRRFAHRIAMAMGSPVAFYAAIGVVVAWGVSGPLFRYSDAWQLTINTATTVVTFLMVFVIQNTQNRDSQVAQLKLDELIRAVRAARNELVDLEALSDAELDALHGQFAELRHAALQRAGQAPTDGRLPRMKRETGNHRGVHP